MYGVINAATSVLPVKSANVSQTISKIIRKIAPIATQRLVRLFIFFDIIDEIKRLLLSLYSKNN